MDSPKRMVRHLIYDLLVAVGKEHPQALVYPLSGILIFPYLYLTLR